MALARIVVHSALLGPCPLLCAPVLVPVPTVPTVPVVAHPVAASAQLLLSRAAQLVFAPTTELGLAPAAHPYLAHASLSVGRCHSCVALQLAGVEHDFCSGLNHCSTLYMKVVG